jgi:DeoR/GlpR family transcriptional regulator of sugar metabolism
LIRQEKLVSIHELADRLDVSYMTISRDLEELEAEGSLRRIRRGGAMLIKKDIDLASPSFPLFDPQHDPHHLKKAAIGRYAARHLVQDGDYITIETGSTASSMIVPAPKQSRNPDEWAAGFQQVWHPFIGPGHGT